MTEQTNTAQVSYDDWHCWVYLNVMNGSREDLRDGKISFCQYFWSVLAGSILTGCGAILGLTIAYLCIVPYIAIIDSLLGTYVTTFPNVTVFGSLIAQGIISVFLSILMVKDGDMKVYPKWYPECMKLGVIWDKLFPEDTYEQKLVKKEIAKKKEEEKRLRRERNIFVQFYRYTKAKYCPNIQVK